MQRTTKALLIGCIFSLVAGLILSADLIKVPNAVAGVYVLLPAGAILFGLFLISKALEKETKRYDEEQRANRNCAVHCAMQREQRVASHTPDHPPIHDHEKSFARSH